MMTLFRDSMGYVVWGVIGWIFWRSLYLNEWTGRIEFQKIDSTDGLSTEIINEQEI